jgi:acetyl-CoA acetyltransferase
MIADPFTKLHCCIRSDGGAAAVLVSADRAKDLKSKPIWVLGAAGPRQVPGAEIACVSGTGGWFCSSGTVLLGANKP